MLRRRTRRPMVAAVGPAAWLDGGASGGVVAVDRGRVVQTRRQAGHGVAGSLAPATVVARSHATAASGGRKRVGLGLGQSWTRRSL